MRSFWECATTPWSQAHQDYQAELFIAARQVLSPEAYRQFVLHEVQGLDYRACGPILHLDKGQFFHSLYRLQETLAKELHRRGVYPADEYFSRRVLVWPPRPAPEHATGCTRVGGSVATLRVAA